VQEIHDRSNNLSESQMTMTDLHGSADTSESSNHPMAKTFRSDGVEITDTTTNTRRAQELNTEEASTSTSTANHAKFGFISC